MKILKNTINSKTGKITVTVELEKNETLMAVREDSFYKLGYPIEEIVPTHVLTDSELVSWCCVEQKWKT